MIIPIARSFGILLIFSHGSKTLHDNMHTKRKVTRLSSLFESEHHLLPAG